MKSHLTHKEARDFAVKKARNGRGIFARRDFRAGEVLFRVMGRFVTCNEDDEMDETARANAYRYDEDWFITPGGRLGDFLNHSCAPNAKIVKRGKKLLLVVVHAIRKGEEVVMDYSTILAADDVWTMRCNCGAPHCRRTIKSYAAMPPKGRAALMAAGLIPAYIRAIKP